MPSLVAIGLVVVMIQQLKYFTWPCKTTWSKDLVNLWKETPHCISPPCPTDSHRHYVNGYIILLVCQVLLQGLGIIWSCESFVPIGIMIVKICFWFVTWSHKITWSCCHLTLLVKCSQSKSPSCQVLWP